MAQGWEARNQGLCPLPYITGEKKKVDLSNREILLMISLLLRMSIIILLSIHRLTGACSRSSQFLVKNKYAGPGKMAINGASNGGKLTPLLSFIRVLTSR